MKVKQIKTKTGNRLEITGSQFERIKAMDDINYQLKVIRYSFPRLL